MNKQIGIKFEKTTCLSNGEHHPINEIDYSLFVTDKKPHVSFDRLHEELSKRPELLGKKLGFIYVTENAVDKRVTLHDVVPFIKQPSLKRKGLFPKIMIELCRKWQNENFQTVSFDTHHVLPDGKRFLSKRLGLKPSDEISITRAIELLEKKDLKNKPKPSFNQIFSTLLSKAKIQKTPEK